MTPREIFRNMLWVTGFALAFFVILTVCFHLQSKHYFNEGQAALEKGELKAAEGFFDRSIRAHSVLDGYGGRSARALEQLAADYERVGERQLAIDTWQTLLSALSAIDTGLSRSRRERINELVDKLDGMRRELE